MRWLGTNSSQIRLNERKKNYFTERETEAQNLTMLYVLEKYMKRGAEGQMLDSP